MNLFFTRYTRCPWCGKKAAAGLKKTELRLGIWEYRCGNCKNVCWIDRAHSYRLITLLLAAVFLYRGQYLCARKGMEARIGILSSK